MATYDRQVRPDAGVKVLIDPDRRRPRAEEFGAAEGAATQNLGRAIGSVAPVIAEAGQMRDDGIVREAEVAWRARDAEIAAGFETNTGYNAGPEAARARLREQENARREIMAGLTPRQRKLFDERTAGHRINSADRTAMHSAQQERAATLAAHEASIELYSTDAIDSYSDDALFEDALSDTVAEAVEMQRLQGNTDPAALEKVSDDVTQNILTRRALRIGQDSAVQALQYIDGEPRLSQEARAELREALEPMARSEQVDGMLGQFRTDGVPRGGPSGPIDIRRQSNVTVQRESGGRGDAQNPNSSATGYHQYIDDTWLSNIRRAARNGGLDANLIAGKTDDEILALRSNLEVSEQVFAFDQQVYANIIDGTGQPVTPTNLYVMHHFGEGGGAAILRAMTNNPHTPGSVLFGDAEWARIVRANPGLRPGMTAADIHAYSSRGIGGSSGVPGQRQQGFDYGAAYTFANSITDPKLKDEYLRRLRQSQEVDAAAHSARVGATTDSIIERAIATGDNTISMDEKLLLGPELNQIENWLAARETGSVKDNMDVVAGANRLAMSPELADRQAFIQDGYLERLRPDMTEATYNGLVMQREAVRAELEGIRVTQEQKRANPILAAPVTPDGRQRIGAALDRIGIKPGSGGDAAATNRANQEFRLQQALQEAQIAFWEKNGRPPENTEIDDILYGLTLPTNFGRVPGPNTGFFFQREGLPDTATPTIEVDYNSIPITERQNLAGRLAAVLGRVPTEQEIADAYELNALTKAQVPTDFSTVREIDAGDYTYLAGFLGLDDATINDMWSQYLSGVLSGDIDPTREAFTPAR